MKVFVHVKPGSKHPGIQKLDDSHFVVSVREVARENKANYAVMQALAEYFKVGISRVRIISGLTAKEKIFDIQ